ncbi:nitrophenyl compound nitroreductase subunit ArsF family protein [Chloroflexota bacterium]
MSKSKSLLLIAVIIILIPCLLCSCLTTTTDTSTTDVPEPETNDVPEMETNSGTVLVEVVYFHRAQRCHSCTYAEEQTVYTLETYFKDELDNGIVTFLSVNVQDDSNATIIEKYQAYTSQLFINTITDNSEYIEHIAEIWEVIGDDEAFTILIKSKITDALAGTH